MKQADYLRTAFCVCFVLSVTACKESKPSQMDNTEAGSSAQREDRPAANGGVGGGAKNDKTAGSSGSGQAQTAGRSGNPTSAGRGGSAVQSGGGTGGREAAAGQGGEKAEEAGQSGSAGSMAAASGKQFVYVSGYGSNIHVLELDAQAGQLAELTTVNGGMSPSYMAFSADKRFAYAINEADDANSKVLAFAVDAKTGNLSALNSQITGGSGSPHLAVHPSGKWLAVAHYTSGEVSVLPIAEDGKLGSVGKPDRGPDDDCDKAHQAVFDHSGEHLFVPCLGTNYVLQYKFEAGELKYNDPPTVKVEGGPRHLAFDPAETHAYVLSETASTITWFDYDKATGQLSNPKTINSFDQQAGSSAHIVVHPNGKWLYASNRKENSLGLFSIAADATPTALAFQKEMISTPRDFSIDPTGAWLILANQNGAQTVLLYQIDQNDGKLTRKQTLSNDDKPTFTRALILP
jgi:6-phosphogluconolactonase